MEIDAIVAQIEEDTFWRQNEIRFYQNTLASITDPEDKKRFRRALVVMLYAHFEGYTKFAFKVYVDALNGYNIRCQDALPSLVASTITDTIASLTNHTKKDPFFKNVAPDDTKLHTLARQSEFIQRLHEVNEQIICIPHSVVKTESNLQPIVLKKILFRLGFNIDSLYGIEGKITRLVKARNDIVHGENKDGFEDREYIEIRDMVFMMMDRIQALIMQALITRQYLKAA